MAGAASWGGRAYKAFYRMATDHESVANKTTGVDIGAPTTSDAAYILETDTAKDVIIESSDFAYGADGIGTMTFATSDQGDDMLAWLAIAAPLKSGTQSTTRTQKFGEDGASIGGGASSSDIPYLVISAGADNADGKIPTEMAIVVVSRESYSYKTANNEVNMISLKVTTVACKAASGFAIPQACFDATIWGTISAGDRTIEKDAYALRKNLVKFV